MHYIKTALRKYYIGDKLYYSKSADRYIIASCDFYAHEIFKQMQFKSDDVELIYHITDADTIIHRKGSLLHLKCALGDITAESTFVLGVPRGLDTTQPIGVLNYG